MKLKNFKYVVLIGFIFLMGCATQHNVELADSFWQSPNHKIAVATTKAPKPQIHQVGNQGLLDYAISSAVNSKLDTHLAQTDISWYRNMPQIFAERLQHKNILAKPYFQPINAKKENYLYIMGQTHSEKLLIIKLEALGAKRTYFSVIPKEAPQAYCEMIGELIDMRDNKVLWHHKASITEPVQGAWDQPPNYPNLDHALKLAINSAQHELLDSFFSGR